LRIRELGGLRPAAETRTFQQRGLDGDGNGASVMRTMVIIRSTLVVVFSCLPALAADWPQWRGVNRDGREYGRVDCLEWTLVE
jgi:hypothetical protein